MSGYVDVVVIGGGHNSLAAANILAERGRSVLVLEAAGEPGVYLCGASAHPGGGALAGAALAHGLSRG